MLDTLELKRSSMSMVIDQTMIELAKAGYAAVLDGELAHLRDTLKMTRNAQARLIGLEGESLRRYETLERGMNIETAVRIGEWLWGAERAMDSVPDELFKQLVPIDTVARQYSRTMQELEDGCENGTYRHERLGVLGTFIYQGEVKGVSRKAQVTKG